MQLAYGAGLLTDEAEFQRLADLLVFNEVPYRGGQVLEKALKDNKMQANEKTYEKLADCWIAAGELDKAVDPLQKGGELASTGDMLVRLGEVHAQRQDWEAAKTSIERGINKGKLKDTGAAQLMMGIVLFNEKKLGEARTWFARAQQSPKQRNLAENYMKIIDAQSGQQEQSS
jgi:tetratricopeptide (TPR) repeat protein